MFCSDGLCSRLKNFFSWLGGDCQTNLLVNATRNNDKSHLSFIILLFAIRILSNGMYFIEFLHDISCVIVEKISFVCFEGWLYVTSGNFF